jgi:hypothetical protein
VEPEDRGALNGLEELVAEESGLLEDGLGGAFLEVWGVAVAAEDALDVGAEAGAGGFAACSTTDSVKSVEVIFAAGA